MGISRELAVGLVAAAITFAAYPIYAVEFVGGWTTRHPLTRWMWPLLGLHGDTRPKLVTWFIWMILTGVVFFSALPESTLAGVLTYGAYFVGCTFLFLVCLKGAARNIDALDIACLVVALAAILVLTVVDSPTVATILATIADFMGIVPVYRSVHRDPKSESKVAWTVFFVGACVNVFTFPHPLDPTTWTVAGQLYTFYVIIACSPVCFYVWFRRPPSPRVSS